MNINEIADIKAVSFRLDADLYRRIRIAAAKEGKSAQQYMREALELVVENDEREDAQEPV